jgi:acetyl esterase/lipase
MRLRLTLPLRALPVALLMTAAACAPPPPSSAAPGPGAALLTPQALMAIPHGPPDHLLAYGAEPSQNGELRVPAGPGPHPVVILIHGGCFRADFATAASIAPMADALKRAGIASWSIEYRRVREPGGGWPGTYQDVGHAADHLRALAGTYHLDLTRVVVVGHSAGGHLAMWTAARSRLPATSALYVRDPLPVRGVVDLDGTPDIGSDLPGMARACGDTVVQVMVGGTPQTVPDRYAQVSAIQMVPLGIPQVLVWGALDDQIPLAVAQRYTRAATAAGDPVRLIVDSTAGHFESASPRTALWPSVLASIRALLDGTLPL